MDIEMCSNHKCTRKDSCNRYLPLGSVGLFWVRRHTGTCEKCKSFLLKINRT